MITEKEEDNFTPYLVSFYPNIKHLKQDENQKWFVEQVKVDTKDWYDKSKVNRGIKTSQTSASLIFYDENKNNLFSKLPSDEKTHRYPYGFIWNTDNNIDDECIFCPVDAYVCDHDFTDITDFTNCAESNINNLCKKYKKDSCNTIYRGKLANIMKFARQQTIDLAKTVHDRLNNKLSLDDKIDKQKLKDVMNEMNKKSYYWIIIGDPKLVGKKCYSNYLLYEVLDGDEDRLSQTNIVFHSDARQMSFCMYNEIAIKSHDNCMYFDNLCVNIEAMNVLLAPQYNVSDENIKNFQSFIDACLKTGSKDIVIFRNKKEEELANDANDKFWLKSSPLIKAKITFLEFIDTYCEKFKQYFTEEQKQKIEELRNEKNEETNKIELKENLEIKNNNLFEDKENNNASHQEKVSDRQRQSHQEQDNHEDTKNPAKNQLQFQEMHQHNSLLSDNNSSTKDKANNNISLFGLGCYEITKQEQDGHSCGCCFW